jgi:hypothetical protein
MTAIRKGNLITVAPLVDAMCGLTEGWAIRFADAPQFLFHTLKSFTGDQAIKLCFETAKREGLKLKTNACNFQRFAPGDVLSVLSKDYASETCVRVAS